MTGVSCFHFKPPDHTATPIPPGIFASPARPGFSAGGLYVQSGLEKKGISLAFASTGQCHYVNELKNGIGNEDRVALRVASFILPSC